MLAHIPPRGLAMDVVSHEGIIMLLDVSPHGWAMDIVSASSRLPLVICLIRHAM